MSRKHDATAMGFRITKPPEQICLEATAAAAAELKQVMKVIDDAGCGPLVNGPSGCAALISTAASLYQRHHSLIEADALEYDGPSIPMMRSHIHGGLRGGPGWNPTSNYPEPEPEPPGDIQRPICLQCAQPLSDHVDNRCP